MRFRLRSYDPETDILKGEIVNVCADESILTDGKIDPVKLRPIVYDPVNHDYLEIGAKVGKSAMPSVTAKRCNKPFR